MEGFHLKRWILTLVVLCGLSWNSYGQKTFRRSCDCEYMVDGKCAYTLLLPTGQGEAVCPQDNGGEMNTDIQQRVDNLHRNFTQLLSMYSNQATMLNQVHSTLMDRLLTCPLLQSCAMQGANANASPMPTVEVPGADDSDNLRDPGSTMSTCAEVCPELDTQMSALRIMTMEIERNMVGTVGNMTSIFNMIRSLNATMNQLGARLMAGGGGDPSLGGDDSLPTPDLDVSPASLGAWVSNIVNNGLLCMKKGPLVSGDDSFLPDASITASSVFNFRHVASRVRIKTEKEGDLNGAWCPGEPNTPGQEWIQFDLGRVRTVYGIVTRGRSDYEQWVESYMVYHSAEMNPMDTQWIPIKDMLDLDTMIFNGNKNQNSPKYNYFDNTIQARYVRIIPLSANGENNMCMRADVIGCVEEPTLL